MSAEITKNENAKDIWKKALSELELKIEPLTFKTMFGHLVPESYEKNTLQISCSTDIFKQSIEKKYLKITEEAIKKVSKKNIKLEVVVKNNKTKTTTSKQGLGPLFDDTKDPEEIIGEKIRRTGLSPKFTFENFILGENNQLAYAIATAVAEKPGEVYNPVFFYSGVGLGKTHLMQAIGNRIIKKSPSTRIVYTTGENFTNELIESIQVGKGKGKYTSNEFRNKFRKADVFLIDDVQFIAGKEATQDEFFHTFNTLYMAQKQIIITSDRPPRDFQNIAERITSRFNSGIIADIQPPDFETRVAILRAKRDKSNDPIDNEAISLIAERVSSNIRELEGAYLRVLTIATASGKEINKENVAAILGQTLKEEVRKPTNMNSILKAVCNYYSVKANEIKGKKRSKDIVIPRQVAMYLIKEMTDTPYMSIGDFLGGRDHTTVMHGVDKIEGEISQMGKTRTDINNVRQMISNEQ